MVDSADDGIHHGPCVDSLKRYHLIVVQSLRDNRRDAVQLFERVHENAKTPFYTMAFFTALSLGAHCYVQADPLEVEQEKERKAKDKEEAKQPANPVPPTGAKVLTGALAQMVPQLEARRAVDKVKVLTASVGSSDGEHALNLSMRNESGCVVTGFRGVVYGFDARGRPTRMNKGGEKFAGFDAKDFSVEPGVTFNYSIPFYHSKNVSVALAQVDGFDCKK